MNMKFNDLLDSKANYANPPIPEGYRQIIGKWYKGLTIQDALGNFSVWIPIGAVLNIIDTEKSKKHLSVKFPDGSSQTFNFTSKEAFFRYQKTSKYHSTIKYGGCYVGQYPITSEYSSRPNQEVLTGLYYYELLSICKKLGYGNVLSEMMYESERDLFLMWLLLSGIMPEDDLCIDSSNIGVYLNLYDNHTYYGPDYTSNHPSRLIFNISDICGNLWEVVQGTYCSQSKHYAVKVGGSWDESSKVYPAISKGSINLSNLSNYSSRNISTRHSLLIK